MRPSRNRFQQAKTVWLYRLLADLNLLESTRVTDVVKFRGAAPAGKAWASADAKMREQSLEVFLSEFQDQRPSTVILSGGSTQNAFKGLLRLAVKTSPTATSTRVLDSLYDIAIPTYFYSAQGWKYEDIHADWRQAIGGARRMPVPKWLSRFRAGR